MGVNVTHGGRSAQYYRGEAPLERNKNNESWYCPIMVRRGHQDRANQRVFQ
jgi:hypothetical protein